MPPIPLDEWQPPSFATLPNAPQRPRRPLPRAAPQLAPSHRVDPPHRDDLLPHGGPHTVAALTDNATRYYAAQNAPPVLIRGDPEARLLILGESPGDFEIRLRQPFSGTSGRLLEDVLAKCGLSSKSDSGILLTNVSFWTTQGNPDPTLHRLAAAQPFLLALAEILQPKAILTVGNGAIQAVSGVRRGISGIRGQIQTPAEPWTRALKTPPPPIIPTWHPAYVVRRRYAGNLLSDLVADTACAAHLAGLRDSPVPPSGHTPQPPPG